MPNWCYNRITVYGNEQTEKIKKVEKIFESKTPFNDIFPQPDWKNTPNKNGELPILEQHKGKDGEVMFETYTFQMVQMMIEWYHWCIENWGTKWDDMLGYIGIRCSFNTAWSPPESMTHSKFTFNTAMDEPPEGVIANGNVREKFPELTFHEPHRFYLPMMSAYVNVVVKLGGYY